MNDTRQDILNHAEYLVRTKGANGFSYADLATKLGIRKASIHYHFPSKNDLLQCLIQTYHQRTLSVLDELGQFSNLKDRLIGFVDIYRQGVIVDALCLCGMLTLDHNALTSQMQAGLDQYFHDLETWLTNLFTQGQHQQQWQLSNSPELEAKAFLALVQGAQIISRNASKGVDKFDTIIQHCVKQY